MSQIINPRSLPTAMNEKLQSIRRRQAVLVLGRAVAIGLSVLVGTMLLAMIADWWFTLFSTAARTLLTVSSLGLAVAACALSGVRPLLSVIGWKSAAASADDEIPELEERWTTVASFAVSRHQPTSAEGRAMLDQVTSEAVALGRLVQPQRVARPAVLKPALSGLLAAVVLLAGFLALDWSRTSVLLRRFWSPAAPITATQLHSASGDLTVPRGESVALAFQQSGLLCDAAVLTLAYDGGTVDVFDLESDETNTFRHALRADDAFRYRVRAGDAQTDWRTVTVIDCPALGEVRFTVTAPAYVDRPALEKTLIPGRVRAVQGSRLELAMKPLAELARLELTLSFPGDDGGEIVETRLLSPDADGWYRFESQLLEDVTLTPVLFNDRGWTNEDLTVCRIQVIPDQAPVARVISPTEEMAVAVDDVIDVEFEAHDDHGVASAELVVYDESLADAGVEPRIISVQPIPLGEQELDRHVLAKTQLDLTKLNLEEGMEISYAVRVTDNRQVAVDPDAMVGQRAEARPGDTEAEQQFADAEDADQATEPGDFERNADPREPAGNALAAAQKPVDRQATDSPSSAENRADSSSSAREPAPEAGRAANDRQSDADDSESTADPGDRAKSEGTSRDSGAANPREIGTDRDTPNENGPAPDDANPPDQSPTPTVAQNSNDADPKSDSADEVNDPLSNRPSQNTAARPESVGAPNADAESGAAAVQASQTADSADSQRNRSASQAGPSSDPQMRDDVADPEQSPSEPQPPAPFALSAQQAQGGQNAETNRRTLKITERLTALAAAADEVSAENMEIREQVVAIDRMLSGVELALRAVVQRDIPDADRGAQFLILDEQFGLIETYVAELRDETEDGQYAFVGLQMVDIGRTHVTPARDRVFAAIRDTAGALSHATDSLQHVVRARELLAALLERYDAVVRERELANDLDEAITMYEVYVEKMQQLMREARQTRNPLERKMGIIEVDQDYLDRYAEVLTLRREMLAEFARMLADDPRLLARYLDLTKRRRDSLRDQLTELAERQYDASTELSGWLLAGDDQRRDLWMLVAEMRLRAATALARDAAELTERLEKQMPLVLDPEIGTAALVREHAATLAGLARDIGFAADGVIENRGMVGEGSPLLADSERLVWLFSELDAALDRLNFENEQDEEVTEYVSARLLESRTVADQANAWLRLARSIALQHYAGLAEVDQQQIAIATELLRVEILAMENDLNGQFQQQVETDLPGEIVDMIRELHRIMEGITFHQQATAYALSGERLETAVTRQAAAMSGFEQAEELFDRIRRAVIAALDEYDLPDPNIANLEDPTLDEFLADLEREPNIEALLGIPDRPRNLRIVADSMRWQEQGGEGLGQSMDAAVARAEEIVKRQRRAGANAEDEQPEPPETQQEQQMAAEQMQELIARMLADIQEQIDDPQTTAEHRRQLEQRAESLKRMQEQAGQQPRETWERLAQSDEAREILRALASGNPIPDQQWNRLMSTLNDGLWQVQGRTPPEDYRAAIEQYQERIRRLIGSPEDQTE